jgi:hypothetical protein
MIPLFCLLAFGLEAAEFSHSIFFTPIINEKGENSYMASLYVDKIDVGSLVFDFPCAVGEVVETSISNDEDDIFIQSLVFQDEAGSLKAKTQLFTRKDNVDVLAAEKNYDQLPMTYILKRGEDGLYTLPPFEVPGYKNLATFVGGELRLSLGSFHLDTVRGIAPPGWIIIP